MRLLKSLGLLLGLQTLLLASDSEGLAGKYFKGPIRLVHQERNLKMYQELFFEIDSNLNAVLRSLPIIIEGSDSSFGGSDGPSFVESGKVYKEKDTLIFEIKRANTGPGGPSKHLKNRKFKIVNNSLIEFGTKTKYVLVRRKNYFRLLQRFGVVEDTQNAK